MPNIKMKIEEIAGSEGNCLALNDFRIAGSKPWGGGRVVKTWFVMSNDLQDCINKAIQAE